MLQGAFSPLLLCHLCVRMPPGGKLARFHVDQTGSSREQRLRDQYVLVELSAFSERSLGPLQITGAGLDNLLLVYLEAETSGGVPGHDMGG